MVVGRMPGLSNDGSHKRIINLSSIEVESGELKEEGAAISITTHYPSYLFSLSYKPLPDHSLRCSSSHC